MFQREGSIKYDYVDWPLGHMGASYFQHKMTFQAQLACSRTILAPSCQPNVCLAMSMIVACHHLLSDDEPRAECRSRSVVGI